MKASRTLCPAESSGPAASVAGAKTRLVVEDPTGRIVELADSWSPGRFHSGPPEHDFVAEAFATLPLRWQRVLWFVEVEGLKPREAAPLLDVAPSALSALLRRARKGLREAYLVEYLRNSDDGGCESMLVMLASAALDRATVADQARPR